MAQRTSRGSVGYVGSVDIRLGLLVFASGVVAPFHAQAQLSSWTGNGSSGNWSISANWDTPPVPAVFSDVEFNVYAPFQPAGSTIVDAAYNIDELRFQPGSAFFVSGFTVNSTVAGSLTVGGAIINNAGVPHRFAVPVTFTNALSSFVGLRNQSSGISTLGFDDTAEVLAGVTLAVNTIPSAGLALTVEFTEGLSGAGNLQTGTEPFVASTTTVLYGNNTLSGDLRMRNPVSVIQNIAGTEVGSLTSISNVFIESPVNFTPDRAKLSFGGTPGSPYILSSIDYINDTATLNLVNGHLNLEWNAPSYGAVSIEENTSDIQFRFGHSLITLRALSPVDSFTLNATALTAIESGATGVLNVWITDAIPPDPEPFIGAGKIVSHTAVPVIGGNSSTPTKVPIVPWLVAGINTGVARTFLTYTTALTFAPLDNTNYLSAIALAGPLDNVSAGNETLTANASINALRMTGNSSSSVNLGGFELVNASGAYLFTGSGNRSISNGTLTYSGEGYLFVDTDTTISASINGTGNLTISGSKPLLLSGANTHQGITYVNQDVRVANNSALGASSAGTWLNQDVELVFLPGAPTVDEEFFVKGSAVTFTVEDTSTQLLQNIHADPYVPGEALSIYYRTLYGPGSGATFVISGDIRSSVQTDHVFNAFGDAGHGEGSSIEVAGVIEDLNLSDPQIVSVFKDGKGNLVLANDNLYSGATTVSKGALTATMQSANGSATGTGTVFIEGDAYYGSSATPFLAGDGRIAGNVFINGASVKPAVSPGAMGNLTLGSNLHFNTKTFGSDIQMSYFVVDLSGSSLGAQGTDSIRMSAASTPTLFLDEEVVLMVTVLDDVIVGDFFDIVIGLGGSLNVSGFFVSNDPVPAVLTNGSTFDVSTSHGTRSFQINYLSDRVRLSAIPEPHAAALLLGSLLFLLRARRPGGA